MCELWPVDGIIFERPFSGGDERLAGGDDGAADFGGGGGSRLGLEDGLLGDAFRW